MFDTCVTAPELLCKHVRATRVFYFDLNQMPAGVTASNPIVDSEDSYLTIGTPEVITVDVTVERQKPCQDVMLRAGRAIKFTLGAGTVSDEEVIVTAEWDQSDGARESRDGRLIVSGAA